jgi:drug/metabolite transporter (DMT)-like permease
MTPAPRHPLAGILMYLGTMSLFPMGDAMLKLALATLSVPQTMLFRLGAFLLLALVFVALRGGIVRALRTRHPFLQVLRGLLLLVDTALFSIAIQFIGIAATAAIYATGPLIATALAVPVLGEKVGWRRWTAVGVGFAGALLIIRPDAGVLGSASLLALAGAGAYGLYSVLTRRVGLDDMVETSFLYVAIVGAAVSAPLGLLEWRTPDATGWTLLMGMTAASLTAHVLMLNAYRLTPATTLAPFSYLSLANSTVIGVLVFSEELHPLSLAGALIVAGSGLYVGWRERVRAAERAGGGMASPA